MTLQQTTSIFADCTSVSMHDDKYIYDYKDQVITICTNSTVSVKNISNNLITNELIKESIYKCAMHEKKLSNVSEIEEVLTSKNLRIFSYKKSQLDLLCKIVKIKNDEVNKWFDACLDIIDTQYRRSPDEWYSILKNRSTMLTSYLELSSDLVRIAYIKITSLSRKS